MKSTHISRAILFVLLVLFFTWLISFLWGKYDQSKTTSSDDKISVSNENKKHYVSEEVAVVGSVGVAITTNVGTRLKERKELPVTIYKDVIDIGYILSNDSQAKDKIITVHMIILREYLNILKTDITELLAQSNDRESTLNSYIAQLEYRYKIGIENSKTLQMQRTELTQGYNDSTQKLDALKQKLGNDFGNFDNKATLEDIDAYFKLKNDNTSAKTYLTFVNKFLTEYQTLQNYNKKLLDTLINNKETLIKNAHVVIPNTGDEILRDIKLLNEEDDIKKAQKEAEITQ